MEDICFGVLRLFIGVCACGGLSHWVCNCLVLSEVNMRKSIWVGDTTTGPGKQPDLEL